MRAFAATLSIQKIHARAEPKINAGLAEEA
jgi:hypothetical protein